MSLYKKADLISETACSRVGRSHSCYKFSKVPNRTPRQKNMSWTTGLMRNGTNYNLRLVKVGHTHRLLLTFIRTRHLSQSRDLKAACWVQQKALCGWINTVSCAFRGKKKPVRLCLILMTTNTDWRFVFCEHNCVWLVCVWRTELVTQLCTRQTFWR